jgi:hypothetical protein
LRQGGACLLKTYSVYQSNREVGCAKVETEGLYCNIACTCRLNKGIIYALFAQGKSGAVRLGIPVPMGDTFVLKTRIPTKKLPNDVSSFYILENTLVSEENRMPLEEGGPVGCLTNILEAKLKISGDEAFLVTQHR